MGLYNFKERFIPRILDGSKTHTIRPERSRPDKPGDTLHLYTGLRHKGARLLMRVPCVKVEEITIEQSRDATYLRGEGWAWLPEIRIDGSVLDASECEAFARRDGFENFDDMMNFWAGRLPFRGQIVHWKRAA